MSRRLLAAAIVFTSSLASAGASPEPRAVALVHQQLVAPLAAKRATQSKFSRARLPPAEQRVRLLDPRPQRDRTGAVFFAFAIDARYGWSDDDDDARWTPAVMTGCVYPDRGEVYLQRGDAYHPGAAALGKKTPVAPEATCRPQAPVS